MAKNYYFGGAFDPIRLDHIKIIKAIIDIAEPESTVIVGVTDDDEKQYKASIEHRMNMVNDVLDALCGKSYAVNTALRCVKQDKRTYEFINSLKVNESCPFVICVGYDEYIDLIAGKWKDSEKLLTLFDVLVIPRTDPEHCTTDAKYPSHILLNVGNCDQSVSSTVVRSKIYNGECVNSLLAHRTLKYIQENHLYAQDAKDAYDDQELLKKYDLTKYDRPSVTATILVSVKTSSNDELILLERRGGSPFKHMWALPGGFLDMRLNERLEETAIRELKEETGIEVSKNELKFLGVFSKVDQDPRGRIIDNVYVAKPSNLLQCLNAKAKDDAAELKWFNINEIPDVMAFCHHQVIEHYFLMGRKGVDIPEY